MKKLYIYIILVVVIAIGVWFWMFNYPKTYTSKTYTIPLIGQDWKIYDNNHFGLWFQYPVNVTILEQLKTYLGTYLRDPSVILNFPYINAHPGWEAKLMTIYEYHDSPNCYSHKLNNGSMKNQVIGNMTLAYEYEYTHHAINYKNMSGGTTSTGWSGALKQFYYPVSTTCYIFREEIINANADVPMSSDIQNIIDSEFSNMEKMIPSIEVR